MPLEPTATPGSRRNQGAARTEAADAWRCTAKIANRRNHSVEAPVSS